MAVYIERDFGFFVSWHINFRGLYAKSTFIEPLWQYLINSWRYIGVHTFPRVISLKVKLISRLEFELASYEAAVKHVSHYPTGTSPDRLVFYNQHEGCDKINKEKINERKKKENSAMSIFLVDKKGKIGTTEERKKERKKERKNWLFHRMLSIVSGWRTVLTMDYCFFVFFCYLFTYLGIFLIDKMAYVRSSDINDERIKSILSAPNRSDVKFI